MSIAFYIAAVVSIISSALVIAGKNAVHSLLYLVVSLLAVAVVFFALGAPFIAALEVIVYAGAIMVLFIFVVMMLNQGRESIEDEAALLEPAIWRGPAILSGILVIEVICMICRSGMDNRVIHGTRVIEPKELSIALFGPYALAVELASILLLAGLVGAFHLGRRDRSTPSTMSTASTGRKETHQP